LLIKCVECGKVFSDKATDCPSCACPTEYILKYDVSTQFVDLEKYFYR